MVAFKFLMFCTYLLPVAFMPKISERFGVSKPITGTIIAVYPIGSIVATFVIGKYQSKIGKIVIINRLTYCFFFSMLIFGIAIKSPDKNIYIGLCFVARLL